MRSLSRIIVIALAALLLLPAVGRAQDVRPIEPPMPCPGCWWPVDQVAQLDGIEADVEVSDGVTVARYRFDLSNPAEKGQGGPGAEGRIVFPVPSGSSVTEFIVAEGYGTLLDEDAEGFVHRVGAGYFGSLGAPVLQGRDFDGTDTDNRYFVFDH